MTDPNSLGLKRGVTGHYSQMTSRDATFIFDERPGHPEMFVACYLFGADIGAPAFTTEAELYEWMRARLGTIGFLTRRVHRAPLDLDLPYWVPVVDIDVSSHVRLHSLQGAWSDLRSVVADIASTPVTLDRPPWELHAITGVRDIDDRPVTAMVIKLHHCAADGMGVRELELRLFSDVASALSLSPPRAAHWLELAVRSVARVPWQTVQFLRWARRTRAAVADAERRMDSRELYAPRPDRPVTRFNTAASGTLSLEVTSFELADIRSARSSQPGATVNDVLLTIVGGALRRLVPENEAPVDRSLAALVPISLRLPDSRSGRSRGSDDSSTSANQLSLGTVDLHTDVVDPSSRLAAVSRSSAAEKARWMDPDLRLAQSRMDRAPAWLLALRGWLRRRPSAEPTRGVLRNTMISNLPSPVGSAVLNGAPLGGAFGVLPVVDGDRLRHLFTASGDRMWLSVSADSDGLEDLPGYLASIHDELNGLLARPR